MDMQELVDLDATAQPELVRRHEVTAAELVEAPITRIELVDPPANAVVTLGPSPRRAALPPACG